MIEVKFKNLEKSEMTRAAVKERLEALIEKFPDLQDSRLRVTLEMENSPFQAGPDLFKVKVYIAGARYDGIIVEKADSNLYVALADVLDHMLEILNRYGDRARVKARKRARAIARDLEVPVDLPEQKFG